MPSGEHIGPAANKAAKRRFKARVGEWALELGVETRAVTVRPLTTKWASCSTTGRLTFDAQVPDLSPALQDYVIVHELLHFSVPNHGRLWKSLMRAHLGEYEDREKGLMEVIKRGQAV
jgi:predicted metal-dependent hydrolase